MGTFAFLASRDARPPPPTLASTLVRARAAAHVWRRGRRDAQNENLCGPFPSREWGEWNESGVPPHAERVEGKRGRPGYRGAMGEECASGTRLCTGETLKQGHKDGRMATGSRYFSTTTLYPRRRLTRASPAQLSIFPPLALCSTWAAFETYRRTGFSESFNYRDYYRAMEY